MTEERNSRIAGWMLTLLLLSSLMSGVGLDFGSVHLNAGQLAGLIMCVILAVLDLGGRLKVPVMFRDNASILIYLYFFTNLCSSLWISSDPLQSLKGCTVMLVYLLVYSATRSLMKFNPGKILAVERWNTLNYLSAAFGLACMGLAILSGGEGNVGVSYGHLAAAARDSGSEAPPSIRSLAIEPNLFAITTATLFCLSLSLFMWRRSVARMILLVLLGLAILFAYTRSAYIGMLSAAAVMLAMTRRPAWILKTIGYGTAVVLLFGAALYFMPATNPVRTALVGRITSLTDFKSGTGLGRINTYRLGWRGFLESPIIGKGTLTAPTRYYNPRINSFADMAGSPGWLTGLWIQALHDTGIIGFLVVMGIFAALFHSNIQVYRMLDPDSQPRAAVRGFIGGNVVLFITMQLSSSMWIAFPWIFWGVNLSFLSWCRETKLNPA